jgi:spermidine/putrescine transport system substrate-binding protein
MEESSGPPGAQLQRTIDNLNAGRISRRAFLARTAALGLSAPAIAALLAACGATAPEQASTSPSPVALDTTLPAKLFVYSWADYTAPSVIKKFERKYGIKVVQTYYDDNEALIAKLQGGARGWDVIAGVSDYAVHRLIEMGMLEALNMSYVPNFQYVGEEFRDPIYDRREEHGGRKHSVVADWGTTGIAVRLDKVQTDVTKWASLWDPTQKDQIIMLNDEHEVLYATLQMLGYNENCTEQGKLDQATQKAIEQKPLVRAYDSLNTKRDIVSGVPLVHAWDSWAFMAAPEVGAKMKYVLPLEGFNAYTSNHCIPVGAKSPYAAHLYVNFMIDPKISAERVNWNYFRSPVPAAEPYLDPVVRAFALTDEEKKRIQWETDLGAFEAKWVDAWEKIKAS